MSIDFNIPKLLKIEDDEYFDIGSVNFFNNSDLVLSASTLKEVFNSDAYEVLIKNNKKEISKELQYVFNTGSAFHCYILENSEFDNRYIVSDKVSCFEDEYRVHINTKDFNFIKEAYTQIKLKYPYILEESEWNEVTILTNIDGVPFRAKIDKLIDKDDEVIIIDLKSVWFDFYGKKFKRSIDGIRWGLVRAMQDLNYDLQAVSYTKAIQTYLDSNNIDKNVSFKILLASKETNNVKMVEFGSEMMENGQKKWDLIYPELRAFYLHGGIQIEKDEII